MADDGSVQPQPYVQTDPQLQTVAPPEDAKNVLQSRTIAALIVAVLATVAQHYGHHVASGDEAVLLDAVTGVLQYGGMAAAAIFRVLAFKPLK